jgi:hypothetical protein
MNNLKRGEILEPVLILIGLLIVFFIFVLPTGPGAKTTDTSKKGSAWDIGDRTQTTKTHLPVT